MTKQYFKKITATIVVIAMGLLFAGCQDETQYSPSPQQPQQPKRWPSEENQSRQLQDYNFQENAGWQNQ